MTMDDYKPIVAAIKTMDALYKFGQDANTSRVWHGYRTEFIEFFCIHAKLHHPRFSTEAFLKACG